MIRAVFFQRHNARGAIYVALHKMAAEAPVSRESTLEIDAALLAQRFQVCAVESLFEEIEGNLFAAMGRDRQAAAIDRNAVADLDFLCDTRRNDLKLRTPITRVDPEDIADFFNQTREHELIVHRLTQIGADFLPVEDILLWPA